MQANTPSDLSSSSSSSSSSSELNNLALDPASKHHQNSGGVNICNNSSTNSAVQSAPRPITRASAAAVESTALKFAASQKDRGTTASVCQSERRPPQEAMTTQPPPRSSSAPVPDAGISSSVMTWTRKVKVILGLDDEAQSTGVREESSSTNRDRQTTPTVVYRIVNSCPGSSVRLPTSGCVRNYVQSPLCPMSSKSNSDAPPRDGIPGIPTDGDERQTTKSVDDNAAHQPCASLTSQRLAGMKQRLREIAAAAERTPSTTQLSSDETRLKHSGTSSACAAQFSCSSGGNEADVSEFRDGSKTPSTAQSTPRRATTVATETQTTDDLAGKAFVSTSTQMTPRPGGIVGALLNESMDAGRDADPENVSSKPPQPQFSCASGIRNIRSRLLSLRARSLAYDDHNGNSLSEIRETGGGGRGRTRCASAKSEEATAHGGLQTSPSVGCVAGGKSFGKSLLPVRCVRRRPADSFLATVIRQRHVNLVRAPSGDRQKKAASSTPSSAIRRRRISRARAESASDKAAEQLSVRRFVDELYATCNSDEEEHLEAEEEEEEEGLMKDDDDGEYGRSVVPGECDAEGGRKRVGCDDGVDQIDEEFEFGVLDIFYHEDRARNEHIDDVANARAFSASTKQSGAPFGSREKRQISQPRNRQDGGQRVRAPAAGGQDDFFTPSARGRSAVRLPKISTNTTPSRPAKGAAAAGWPKGACSTTALASGGSAQRKASGRPKTHQQQPPRKEAVNGAVSRTRQGKTVAGVGNKRIIKSATELSSTGCSDRRRSRMRTSGPTDSAARRAAVLENGWSLDCRPLHQQRSSPRQLADSCELRGAKRVKSAKGPAPAGRPFSKPAIITDASKRIGNMATIVCRQDKSNGNSSSSVGGGGLFSTRPTARSPIRVSSKHVQPRDTSTGGTAGTCRALRGRPRSPSVRAHRSPSGQRPRPVASTQAVAARKSVARRSPAAAYRAGGSGGGGRSTQFHERSEDAMMLEVLQQAMRLERSAHMVARSCSKTAMRRRKILQMP